MHNEVSPHSNGRADSRAFAKAYLLIGSSSFLVAGDNLAILVILFTKPRLALHVDNLAVRRLLIARLGSEKSCVVTSMAKNMQTG